MAFETILETLTAGASKVPAIGKSLKFDFGETKIVVDGTGTGNVISTEDKEADCTVAVSQEDLIGMMNGTVNPMTAFMSGKVKVHGDMGVAMKMQSLFK